LPLAVAAYIKYETTRRTNSRSTMTTSRFRLLAVPLLAALMLAGCDFNPGADRTGCDGFIEVLRTLPDTTLVEDGPPLVQELEGEEPFFRHTEDKHVVYLPSFSSDPLIAGVRIVGDSATVLQVLPRRRGETRIGIVAQDDCDKEARFSFDVEVIPSE
jgi:hypothetical protein